MKYLLIISAMLLSFKISAQTIPRKAIEDSVLGWIKVYNYKGTKAGITAGNNTYSGDQVSICDSFVNWMQASYIPKGGLGDIGKAVSGKLTPYNQYEVSLPPSYGAVSKTYHFLKYSNKKIVPENNLGDYWAMYVNMVPKGWPIMDICTPTQYYFTMPSFDASATGGEATKKIHDLSGIKNVQPFINFWIKDIEAGGGTDNVLLSKGNRFPFIKLTKGDYLKALETAIPIYYASEKKKIENNHVGDKKNTDYYVGQLDGKIKIWKVGLQKNKEKYKNRLEEIALTKYQPGFADLENDRDAFTGSYLDESDNVSNGVPVYTIAPDIAELSKKGKPQWILISWQYDQLDAVSTHLHQSIINNFNFQYVYNFFFDPEKVKGQSYKPLRYAVYEEPVAVAEASAAKTKNATDENIYFFEDFSTTGIGQKPVGWKTRLAGDGTTCVVTKLEGLDGVWAVSRGHYLGFTNLKKSFPQNFTLSYDLIAAQNFTWGAKGLTLQLAKETSPGNAESYLKLKLRPGFDGRNGELELETKFPAPPGYSDVLKWFTATGFSNDKKYNRVTVTIKKKDEMLQIFIDSHKIAELEKAIPPAQIFNTVSFDCNGNVAENDKFYVSNIKIRKD